MIDEERYQAIRRRVQELSEKRLLADSARRSDDRSFDTVDAFMRFLDTLVDRENDTPLLDGEDRRSSIPDVED